MALTAFDILGTIRDNASDLYVQRIPTATKDNLKQLGDALASDKNIMNEFISTLMNKIATQDVITRMFQNPLARLKKSSNPPLGAVIEELYVNPAVDTSYDPTGAGLLKQTKPDAKTAYYSLGRRSSYPVTITSIQIQQAFQSANAFMQFYNTIITSLYSGCYIDEFKLMKGLFAESVDAGAMKVVGSDLGKPKQLAKDIATINRNFSFPSTAWNGYNLVNAAKITAGEKKCLTWCETDNQALIIRSDANIEMIYEYLSSVYNIDMVTLRTMTIEVDSFPTKNTELYAVLCDNEAVQVKDVVFQMEEFRNGSNMSWNFWLHCWQYLYLSLFANAVAFAASGVLSINSVAGAASGATKITVVNTVGAGNKFKYKIGATAQAIKVGDTATGYTDLGTADITAASGQIITIVEVDATDKVLKVGTATIQSKP